MTFLPTADGLPSPLRDALEAAHRVFGDGGPGSVVLAIESARAELVTTAEAVSSQNLALIAASGGEAHVTLEAGALTTTIMFVGSSSPDISVEGPPEEVFATPDEVDEFRRAVEQHDSARVLASMGSRPCRVAVAVRNDPIRTGIVWAPTRQVLIEALTSDRWLAAAKALLRGADGPDGRRVVVIGDAGAAWLTCQGLRFAGPAAPPASVDEEHPRSGARGPDDLLSPERFAPEPAAKENPLNDLRAALNRLVIHLVWLDLADEQTAGSPPQIILRGVREQRLLLAAPPTDTDPEPALQLWRWAGRETDPAKHEAIQQAATFAISGEADLDDAAEPVLRTARSLYELARRGAVGEALATRRAAREAAQGTAREAARAARETAARAVERSVVIALGVAGAALAKTQDLLTASQTTFTLGLFAALTALSLIVALASELAVGRQAISTFRADADAYREALSKSDVDAIKQSASLTQASGSLRTATWLVCLTHVVVLIGVLVAAWQSPAWDKKPQPEQSSPASPAATPSLRPSPSAQDPPSTAASPAAPRPSVPSSAPSP